MAAAERVYSDVEQEIIRCAVAGEMADLAQFSVDGALPTISAKFLTDLWLQALPGVAVHPAGIMLTGTRIDGTIMPGGARVDARGRTPLVGLTAFNCRFDGTLQLGNLRVESMYFLGCDIGPENDGEAEGQDVALGLEGAEIVGLLRLERCKIRGKVSLSNTTVDDDIVLNNSHFEDTFTCSGAEVRGGLTATYCRFDGEQEAIEAFDATFGGDVNLMVCRCTGNVMLARAKATGLIMLRLRVTPIHPDRQVALTGLQLDHALILDACRFDAALTATDMQVSSVGIRQCLFGRKASPAVYALSGTSTRAVNIERCRVYGSLQIDHVDAGRSLELRDTTIRATSGEVGLLANALAAYSLTIAGLTINSLIAMQNIRATSLSVSRVAAFGWPLDGDAGVSPHAGLICTGADVKGAAAFDECAIAGGIDARQLAARSLDIGRCWLSRAGEDGLLLIDAHVTDHLRIGPGVVTAAIDAARLKAGSVVLTQTVIQPGADRVALTFSQAQIGGILMIEASVLDGSLIMPLASMMELQVVATMITATESQQPRGYAIWASECVVQRAVFFGEADRLPVTLVGAVDFTNAVVKQDVSLRHAHICLTDAGRARGDCVALNLEGSSISDTLSVAWQHSWIEGQAEPSCIIEGALLLSRATVVTAVIVGRGAHLSALGASKDAAPSSAGQRGHRGMALAARGAKLGELRLEPAAVLRGTCDLRDAEIGTVTDACASAWKAAGISPGQLLLDGLVYRDLDGGEAGIKAMVTARLEWLALQHPDGRATTATFTPQPYDQLARFFAQGGDERARRQVQVERRTLQRNTAGLNPVERIVDGLVGAVGRYGYGPGRAAGILAAFLLLGWLGAEAAWRAGLITDRSNDAHAPFNAALWAIDTAVPLLDLGQDSGWELAPGASIGRGWGSAASLAMAAYRLIGLILVSITVLTFSGVLREKD